MNRIVTTIAALTLATFALAACNTPLFATPLAKTPQQIVFGIEADYNTALAVAVTYESLPRCPAPAPCSDVAAVKRLRDADDHAAIVLAAAEKAVRTPGATESTTAAVIATATEAVGAFKALAALHGK